MSNHIQEQAIQLNINMTNKALSEEEIARRQLIKKRWLGAFVVADIILVALLAWEIVSIFIK